MFIIFHSKSLLELITDKLNPLAINQIAILIVTEDGTVQNFVKDKKDYIPLLQPAIDDFWEKQDGLKNSL